MENTIFEIKQQLARIEANSLLAAKTILTINDVAILTGLSKSYLYRLTCNNEIPHYKPIGKLLYFDKREIETWFKQNRVQTTAEAEQKAIAYIVEKGGAR